MRVCIIHRPLDHKEEGRSWEESHVLVTWYDQTVDHI